MQSSPWASRVILVVEDEYARVDALRRDCEGAGLPARFAVVVRVEAPVELEKIAEALIR
ncbi:hypothetical protein IPV08_21995 [Methylobacterium sp. SD274]|uniref:hypothetical protein n=1 Tax=Methylobacterium sp. SD274 TaxID=2782009 RepID=UPI001A9585F3|nr:hypothetical protein [Methylobacterium sp. SD274]MBO1022636.1 hypothetical protein [Methylobacterium sp. SD274]